MLLNECLSATVCLLSQKTPTWSHPVSSVSLILNRWHLNMAAEAKHGISANI